MSANWDELRALERGDAGDPAFEAGRLSREWVLPPFSILDTTAGTWPDRKRAWLALGIQSDLGRNDGVLMGRSAQAALNAIRSGAPRKGAIRLNANMSGGRKSGDGAIGLPDEQAGEFKAVSIFDPVLCEVAYRWWCPAGGAVLDPFAGGSVRGIVAALLGHPYTGIDLAAAQVEANRQQAERLVPPDKPMPQWIVGDSQQAIDNLPAGQQFDLVFTCPPYYDLEVYSTDPADLSAMGTYGAFLDAYRAIIAKAVGRLRPHRFAAIVVSDVRDKAGFYVGLPRDTEAAFEVAGARKYNEAILVNTAGTLALRAMKQMVAGRKLGRRHQNVLVFAKGDIKTHDWDYERQAPPVPQTDLGLMVEEPVQVPVVVPLPVTMAEEPIPPAGGQQAGDPALVPQVQAPQPVRSRPATPAQVPDRYTLSAEQLAEARDEGRKRFDESKRSGRANEHGLGKRAMALDMIGAAGEIAVRELLGMRQTLGLGTFKRADLGDRIQVRATELPDGRLIIREVDSPAHAYVLVAGMPPSVKVPGWCWGMDVTPEQWDAPADRPGAWFVPQHHLRPLDTLLDALTAVEGE